MGFKQRQKIFVVISVGNLDNTISFDDDCNNEFETKEEALELAKDITDEYGMRTIIYECKPILNIDKGSLRVTEIKNLTSHYKDKK